MKTSELMKIMKENGCEVVKMETGWFDFYLNDAKCGYVPTNCANYFHVNTVCTKVITQAIVEYAYTPLEEREEEKKYLLMFPKGYTKYGKSALTLNIHDNFYFNGGFDAEKTELSNYKKKFTQKEIDEMPFDTKFFEKVEVK